MEVEPTPLAGLFTVQLAAREDDRGYFMRTYDEMLFAKFGLGVHWVQENQSFSALAGTVRGLHFQRAPHSETKFVRVLAGSLLDVAVDLRRGSPTYGRYHAVELTAENRRCLYIPRGFAHGFCTTSPRTIIAYKVDNSYASHAEGGLRWDDPTVGIQWPLTGSPASISTKDAALPPLEDITPLDVDERSSESA